MANEGILLESGTNEVEILEFSLDGQSFGVNVLKIQAIEQFDPDRVTQIQLSHPSIIGSMLFRENCITLIDLIQEMEAPPLVADATADTTADTTEEAIATVLDEAPTASEQPDGENTDLVLVMEFNDMKTAFLVESVNRIHRVSWESIKPLSAYLNTVDSKFTGSMQIEGREILIVDMEKIVTEILPQTQKTHGVDTDTNHPHFAARGTKTVFLAEDSAVIREMVGAELKSGNYTQLQSFPNGKDCLDEIKRLAQQARRAGTPITDYIDALITDIEMPAMDGLALCRTIKSDPQLKALPVIIFSSLINEQVANKCRDVKADSYITKPQFAELVALLDTFVISSDVKSTDV